MRRLKTFGCGSLLRGVMQGMSWRHPLQTVGDRVLGWWSGSYHRLRSMSAPSLVSGGVSIVVKMARVRSTPSMKCWLDSKAFFKKRRALSVPSRVKMKLAGILSTEETSSKSTSSPVVDVSSFCHKSWRRPCLQGFLISDYSRKPPAWMSHSFL